MNIIVKGKKIKLPPINKLVAIALDNFSLNNFMLGQYLISIQHPDNQADWFILNTDKDSYDLKLGGIQKTNSKSKGQLIKLPFDKAKIIRTMTDDFRVYIELDNGYCIVHSDTFICGDGEISFEVYIHNNESYINDGGLEGMFAIETYD